jgi:hypothetical protein
MTAADQPYAPTPPTAPASPVDIQGILLREIQMMTMSGWRVEQRWQSGADFISTSGENAGGISLGVHILLMILTLGLWIPVWIMMEMFGNHGHVRRTRLIIDETGQTQYGEVPKA